jgi:hypothetical protein
MPCYNLSCAIFFNPSIESNIYGVHNFEVLLLRYHTQRQCMHAARWVRGFIQTDYQMCWHLSMSCFYVQMILCIYHFIPNITYPLCGNIFSGPVLYSGWQFEQV